MHVLIKHTGLFYSRIWMSLMTCLCGLSLNGHAAVNFSGIDASELEELTGDFSANFMHTSVSGADTLGHLFGFEAGVLLGVTRAHHVEEIAEQSDPSSDVKYLPHAGILGAVTVPFGFTVETSFIPRVGRDDFKLRNLSLALKWTATESVLDFLPLSLAAKIHVSKTNVNFVQTKAGAQGGVNVDNTVSGISLLASKSLAIVEPYVGVGVVKGKSEISFDGSGTIFDTSLTTSTVAKSDKGSGVFFVGSEFKFVFIKFGLEYARLYETNRYTAKLAAYF